MCVCVCVVPNRILCFLFSIFAQYRKDQLTPVNLSNGTEFVSVNSNN